MASNNSTQPADRSQLPFWLSLAVCVVVVGIYILLHPLNEPPTPSEYDIANRELAAELETLTNHEWAGRYYYDDGLGVNVALAIAPTSGFVFTWHGCGGEYDRNYGSVEYREGVLVLHPKLPNERIGFQGIETEFTLLRWGDRRYLIPADEMITFCNAVNYGEEPRRDVHGFFLLRSDDWKLPAAGFPAVPSEFREYLLGEPIVAEVSAVDGVQQESGRRYTTATLDAGENQGVRPGMEFRLIDSKGPKSTYAVAEITRVQKDACEAKVRQFADDDVHLQVGWVFATRIEIPSHD